MIYFRSLQIFRGLAALAVMLCHVYSYLPGAAGGAITGAGGTPTFFRFIPAGEFSMGASFFFVLSGFLMAYLIDIGYKNFLPRRLLRIYPAFILAVGVQALTQAIFERCPISGDLWKTLSLLPLNTIDHRIPSPLGIEWTLIYEIFFYFVCVFFTFKTTRPWFPAFLVLWAAVIILAYQTNVVAEHLNMENGTLLNPSWRWIFLSPKNLLFIGGGAGYFFLFKPIPRPNWFFIIFCVLMSIIAFRCAGPVGAHGLLGTILITISFLVVIVCAAAREKKSALQPYSKNLVVRLLEKLGDYSYGLYLVHVPVIIATIKLTNFACIHKGLSLTQQGVWVLATALLCGCCYGKIDVLIHGYFRKRMSAPKPIDEKTLSRKTGISKKNGLIFLAGVFVAAILFVFLSVKCLLTIEFADNESSQNCQVFFDRGNGFNEVDSRFTRIVGRDRFPVAGATLPLFPWKNLRIDPSDKPGPQILGKITIQYVIGGETLSRYVWLPKDIARDFSPQHDIDSFAPRDGFLFLNASGRDPYFTFHGNLRAISKPLFFKALKRILRFCFFPIIALCILSWMLFLGVRTMVAFVANHASGVKLWLKSFSGLFETRLNNLKRWSVLLLLLLIIVGLEVGAGLYSKYQSKSVDLVVDMDSNRGGIFRVYINGNYEQPRSLPIQPGKRILYRFPAIPSVIWNLRLDPGDSSGADVRIYHIAFNYGNRELSRVAGSVIESWGLMNIQPLLSTEACFHFKTLTREPIIAQNLRLVFNHDFAKILGFFHSSPLVEQIAEFWSAPLNILFLLTFLCFLILVGLNLNRSWQQFGAPLLIFFVILTVGRSIVRFFLGLSGKPPSISSAVGNASYFGYSKGLEVYAFSALVLVAIITGAVLFLFMKKKRRETPESLSPVSISAPNKSVATLFLFSALVIFSILSFPQLYVACAALDVVKHSPQWDSLNALTWQYEISMGWLPYRDFWFPYGWYAYLVSPFPWDMFRDYLFNFIVFSSFFLAIYWLTNKSKGWTLFITGMVAYLMENGYIIAANRYFISLNYVLCFAALLQSKRSRRIHYILFGIFLGLFFLYDPIYLVYACFPLTILLAIYFFQNDVKSQRSEHLRNLLSCGITFSVFVVGDLVFLWKNGQLPGIISFFAHLHTQAVSSAVPTTLKSWVLLGITPNNLLTQSIPLFIGFGFFLILLGRKDPNFKIGAILLSLGILSFVLFQKNIIRPHIATHIIGIVFVGGLLSCYYWSRCWSWRQKVAAFFLMGIVLGFGKFLWLPTVKRHMEGVVQYSRNVKVLLSNREELARKTKNYFSPKAFERFPGADVFLKYFNDIMRLNGNGSFYVLGDDSFFYILAQQKPPYFLTFYNGCGIFDQKHIVRWLDENKIRYAIWDPSFKEDFDMVPNLVRVPLIFNYIVEHYNPCDTFSKYQVLKRMDREQAPDVIFWKRYLGDTIDLGFLPSLSSAPKLKDCLSSKEPACREFLKIKVLGNKTPQKRTVEIQVGEHAFKVLFQQNAKDEIYYIYLDRLWFWGCLRRGGAKPELAKEQAEDLHFEILYKMADDDLLY